MKMEGDYMCSYIQKIFYSPFYFFLDTAEELYLPKI